MEEIKQLEFEIKVLKERVSLLEKRETRRRNLAILKFIIGLFIFISVIIAIYKTYQKIIDFYNLFSISF